MMSNDVGEAVTIGESQALRKLKVLNNDLSWRLEQRSRTLTSHKAMIEDLLAQLAESKEQVVLLTQERDQLAEKLRGCTSNSDMT
jgi:chromosome segregation ATPase